MYGTVSFRYWAKAGGNPVTREGGFQWALRETPLELPVSSEWEGVDLKEAPGSELQQEATQGGGAIGEREPEDKPTNSETAVVDALN